MRTEIERRIAMPAKPLGPGLQDAILLLIPSAILGLSAWWSNEPMRSMLGVGAGVSIGLAVIRLAHPRHWADPFSGIIMIQWLLALAWLWVGVRDTSHWYFHLARGVLLLVPLIVLARVFLQDSGATALRQARILGLQLGKRQTWPGSWEEIRRLPELRAFRESLVQDASPALLLLDHAAPQVRFAALTALEERSAWRTGEPERILHQAAKEPEPECRSAAIRALAQTQDRLRVEAVAASLEDSALRVRQTAVTVLMRDLRARWPWIRYAVRHYLGQRTFEEEGALHWEGPVLPTEVVDDLIAWAGAKGTLGVRAAQTLAVHYSRCLAEHHDEHLLEQIQQIVLNPSAAPILRLEIARVLQRGERWGEGVLERLLDSANSASLRLVAAESLLQLGKRDRVDAVLRDLARSPNREIALATAAAVQRHLGVDLGLQLSDPLPCAHGNRAIEITRRLCAWASRQNEKKYQLS